MKKVLLFVHLLLIVVATTYAQSLNEDFEGDQFPPKGWETRCIEYSLLSYPKWEQVNNKDINTFVTGYKGGKAAQSTSSGAGFSALWTSNWLITPQITVGNNEYLSFMLGANGAYNDLKDVNPYELKVMVSTAGNDSVSFKETIFSIIPKGVLPWGNYTIDMSKYAGQKVYIAFWDFGHALNATGCFLFNKLYLDNIKMTQTPSPDVALSSIDGIENGCRLEQALKVTVKNTGAASPAYKLCYQVDKNPIVIQNINEALGSGEEKQCSFTEKIKFTEPRQNIDSVYTIKTWVEASNDANLFNDTLSATVVITTSMEYPYKMTIENAPENLRSSAAEGRRNAYWKWLGADEENVQNCWLYSPYVGQSAILASNCITLPQGKVRINFEYQCGEGFTVTASLGNFDYGKYELTGTSARLLASPYEWVKGGFTIDVNELGKYSLGLTTSVAGSQLLMRNIEICDPYNDIVAQKIVSPYANAMMKNNSVTVTATFMNIGKDDLQNIPVHYRLNDGAVIDGVIAALPVGQKIDYTFETKADFSQPGANELKVWSALAEDGDKGNDETAATVQVYEAAGFPYKMGFEPEENWKNWICYNPEKDNVYWEVTQVTSGGATFAKEGQYAAYINSFSGITHNDWLISPAITVPKGKVRLSFYYATLYASGVSNLKVYLGKTDSYSDFKEGTPLATLPIDNVKYYKQGYVLLDIEEAGNYYLAFYNDGSGRDIILDDVRLDQDNDMAINAVGSSAKDGFYLTNADITLSFMNHGTKAISNVPLSYVVYKDGSEADKAVQTVSETYTGTIEPGATIEYTFRKKADISTPGTYFFLGEVKEASDCDAFNNKMFSSNSVIHYEAATIPYVGDLETDLERSQWIFNGGWATGNNFTAANSAYSGTGGIRHAGTASGDGDWVFSGCIEIPAGTYDFGFFYRTYLNISGTSTPEKNGQDFEVFLGEAPTTEAMTMSIYKAEKALVQGREYQKVVKQITIPANGHYYIAVKCTSTATLSSSLFMDYFTIKKPVTTGLSIETEPYIADFANKESEWYHYYPSVSHFEQWTVAKVNDETFMKTQVTRDDAHTGLTYKPCPGAYVAPVISLKKGDIVKATFDYSIIIKSTAPESTEQYVRLYIADKDMPDAFTTLVASGDDNSGDRATASGSITVPADGLYYFGYMVESPVSTQAFNLYSAKIEKTGNDPNVGVQNVETEDNGYYMSGRTLYLNGDYQTIRIYNGNGQLILNTGNASKIELDSYEKGIYILSLTSRLATKTSKFLVK